MASVDRKWLPLVLIAAAVVASALAYGNVPASMNARFEGLLPFDVPNEDETLPRWLALFLMPAVALLVWVAFRMAPTLSGQRFARRLFRSAPEAVTSAAQFERFGKTYDSIALAVVMLLLGFHATLLGAAMNAGPAIVSRILPAVIGACLIWMGNVMPRLRPNWVAGVRTKRTLEDPQLWRTTHRAFGAAFVVSGLVTLVATAVAPRYGVLTGIASLVLSLIVGLVASTRRSDTAGHAVVVAVGLVWASANGLSAQTAQNTTTPVELTAPATVAESPFVFERDGFVLHGTLAVPRSMPGKIPVVLIVAGSGPTDRNANGPLINTNAYAMLAWGLAQHGIASLRYDKRAIGKSAATAGDPTTLTLDDYVADVAAAVAALASDVRFSRVIGLGHSEGAGLVLQAANRCARVAGLILAAPQGRRIAEVLHEQFARQADSATVVKIDSAFARFVRGEDPGEVPPIARTLIIPVYRNFLRSFAAYDPAGEARRYSGSLLILQGTTDVQVTMQDAELLYAAQPRATLIRLTGVNHVLKSVESTDIQIQMKSYKDPSMPLATSVVPAIVRWIEDSTMASPNH